MSSLAASGLDLCKYAAATPPNGLTSNFIDPPTYSPVVVAITAIMLAFAIIFTTGRLFANWKELLWSDYFCLLALIFSLGQGGLIFAQLRYVRHQWDIPACWFLGDYFPKVLFIQDMMYLPGLFFSKTSLLLLLRSIFSTRTKRAMRYWIWFGFAAATAVCLPGIPINIALGTPSPGESWYGFVEDKKMGRDIYWGLVQSVLGIILDLYIFILPLPVVYRLQMSKKKRIQVTAVFSTAFLAVIATVLSLVYRILIYKATVDQTWYMYAMLLCTIVELNISIIVCSMPGFAKLVRLYGRRWISLASRWSKSSSREESRSSGRGLWKMDSLQTGPAEPATFFPRKPQALLLACHPASHSPQPDANMSDEHHELIGSGKLHHPNTQSYNPDGSWLTD